MIAFDAERGTLRLALDDLLPAAARRRHARAARGTARRRREDAARARYVAARDADYRAGRRLVRSFDWDGLRVRIDASLDGVQATAAGAVVEAHRFVPPLGGASDADEVERVGLGCALLARREEVHKGTLVDLSLIDGSETRLDVAFRAEIWERRLTQALERVARDCRRRGGVAEARRALAKELRFPFDAARTGQDVMLRDVTGAAESGLVLLCAAPTGIGKTAAALYPMLVEALREDRTLFFVTARISQQDLALATLRRCLPPGGGAHGVQLRARDRICPREQLGCVERGCPYQIDFGKRLDASGLLDELAASGVIDADVVRERALGQQLCPYELGLALASGASVVVADYNYVFSPDAYLRRFFDEPWDQHLLVVDEAHDLPERARQYYSAKLSVGHLTTLADDCATLDAPYRRAGEVLRDAAEACLAVAARLEEERGAPPPWEEAPDRQLWEGLGIRAAEAERACQRKAAREHGRPAAFAPLRASGDARLRDPLQSALRSIGAFARGCELDPEHFAALFGPGGASLVCLDAAPFLGARIRGFHAAVCMSATLTPISFFAQRLGCDGPKTLELELPSPFPASNRLLLSVGSVDTRYARRDQDAPAIAALIARCMGARRGNYLAFFPSFEYRDKVLSALPRGSFRVLPQLPAMSTAPYLAQLRANRDETLLLAAVHGGVFAEGVDYPGDMAIGVFVVGPGLPRPSAELERIREYHEGRTGQGFEYTYAFPGLNRVVQAGGRALRTPHDRAFVMLVGRRFTEPLYRKPLPRWWLAELREVEDPLPELEAFWKQQPD